MDKNNIHYITNIDKREIIKHQLETNFPTKTTIVFGLVPIIIGLTATALQIALIVNSAVHYEIANGIWGGSFSIINGLIRLNMVRKTYSSYLIYKNLGLFYNILGTIGLVAVSSANLRLYKDFSSPQTSAANFAMTITILVIGIVATFSNFLFLFIFDRLLFSNSPRVHRLTFKESCSDWIFVCS